MTKRVPKVGDWVRIDFGEKYGEVTVVTESEIGLFFESQELTLPWDKKTKWIFRDEVEE